MVADDTSNAQYKWILPEYLELLPILKEVPMYRVMDASDHDARAALYLNLLLDTGCGVYYESLDKDETSELHEFQNASSAQVRKWNVCKFGNVYKMLDALRSVGLDLRGGMEQLDKDIFERHVSKLGFSTVALIVTDRKKAQKYVNLGYHIGTDIPEHPKTLAEAADAYTKICSMVSNTTKIKNIFTVKNKDSSDEVAGWILERLKFRVDTKERYRQILLDMAHDECVEERLEKQLTGLRERKRARLEDA